MEAAMKRDDLNDLAAFVLVADERSFTRASAKLGISPSALSHAMRGLETRLGLRLLARTTRSVSVTEPGERLLRVLRPAFEDINSELIALSALRDKPAGTLRITTFKIAATSVLWPVLPAFLSAHPNIKVEITIDDGLTDIVASRHDAGIRFGEKVDKDMIAVRVGPDIRAAVVASPAYFFPRPIPKKPEDLSQHQCINYRLNTAGGLFQWKFRKQERALQVKVDGALTFNDNDMILSAALAGQGIAYLYETQVAEHLARGTLIRVLEKWCPTFPGLHLYHPSRRQTPPALLALINVLRVKSRQ
jgi:DNA-binding transcriptional LysR family regulator